MVEISDVNDVIDVNDVVDFVDVDDVDDVVFGLYIPGPLAEVGIASITHCFCGVKNKYL